MIMLSKLRNNHKTNINEKYRHLFVIIESINKNIVPVLFVSFIIG